MITDCMENISMFIIFTGKYINKAAVFYILPSFIKRSAEITIRLFFLKRQSVSKSFNYSKKQILKIKNY